MMRASRRILGTIAGGLALLALASGQARAGFTITLDAGSPTGAGPYTYSYTASIPAGDQISSGDFFRIYDFNGYVPSSIAAPAGWTPSGSRCCLRRSHRPMCSAVA